MTEITNPYGVAPEGHRLPADIRLGAVRLQVSDLDRSVDWYGRALGLQVLRSDGGIAELAAGDGDAAATIVALHERSGGGPARARRLGLYHYALLVPHRAALGRLLARLHDTGTPFAASDHEVSEALYLQDPDGLGIEVYADRPRSTWRAAGGQLVMSTKPLDLGDLARAARDADQAPGDRDPGTTPASTALPAGTAVGHVHLHVGDIAEAEAFYHHGLGLDKVVWSYPGALFLSAGAYHHHLGVNTWAGPRAEPPPPDEPQLLQWEIRMPARADVDAAAESLRARGYTVEDGVAADPWGTRVRLRAEKG